MSKMLANNVSCGVRIHLHAENVRDYGDLHAKIFD